MKYEDYKRVLDELEKRKHRCDPFYNEEASIIFLDHTSSNRRRRDTDSTPENLQSDLDNSSRRSDYAGT